MVNEKFIIASGPVIIENGKLLVNKDTDDDFYKIPGGIVDENETLEQGCIREAKEENNAEIEILKPLSPMILWENPQTKEKMTIVLIHFLAKLKNPNDLKPGKDTTEIKWLLISEIKQGKHNVAPNIKFLIEKGDVK